MFHLHETNPHFQSREDVYDHYTPTRPPPQSKSLYARTQPQEVSDQYTPTRPLPQTHPPYSQAQPEDGSNHHIPTQNPPMVALPPCRKADNHSQSLPLKVPRQANPDFSPSSLRIPAPRKTKSITWLAAIFCLLFWVIVIIGVLVLLVIYIAYRPRLPKFDLSGASFNAAYLDMGYLLNADLNLLTNFTNPNKKVNVDFNDIIINLYFEGAHIATRYVDPLSVPNLDHRLSNVHMETSQVPFSKRLSQHLAKQIESRRIVFEIKSYLRTKSSLGSFLKYSYWLYGHCNFVVSAPPDGVLIAKKCVTKR